MTSYGRPLEVVRVNAAEEFDDGDVKRRVEAVQDLEREKTQVAFRT